MKYVGFIKDIDDYEISLNKESYIENSLTEEEKRRLVLHMSAGQLCVPLMGSTENPFEENYDPDDMDKSTNTFSYIAIFTDGYYMWPEYLKDFIETGHITSVNPEFVEHVLKRNFKRLSDKELVDLENQFINDFWKDVTRY